MSGNEEQRDEYIRKMVKIKDPRFFSEKNIKKMMEKKDIPRVQTKKTVPSKEIQEKQESLSTFFDTIDPKAREFFEKIYREKQVRRTKARTKDIPRVRTRAKDIPRSIFEENIPTRKRYDIEEFMDKVQRPSDNEGRILTIDNIIKLGYDPRYFKYTYLTDFQTLKMINNYLKKKDIENPTVEDIPRFFYSFIPESVRKPKIINEYDDGVLTKTVLSFKQSLENLIKNLENYYENNPKTETREQQLILRNYGNKYMRILYRIPENIVDANLYLSIKEKIQKEVGDDPEARKMIHEEYREKGGRYKRKRQKIDYDVVPKNVFDVTLYKRLLREAQNESDWGSKNAFNKLLEEYLEKGGTFKKEELEFYPQTPVKLTEDVKIKKAVPIKIKQEEYNNVLETGITEPVREYVKVSLARFNNNEKVEEELYKKHDNVVHYLFHANMLNELSSPDSILGRFAKFFQEKIKYNIYPPSRIVNLEIDEMLPEVYMKNPPESLKENIVKHINSISYEFIDSVNDHINPGKRRMTKPKIVEYNLDLASVSDDAKDICYNSRWEAPLVETVIIKDDGQFYCLSISDILEQVEKKGSATNTHTGNYISDKIIERIKDKFGKNYESIPEIRSVEEKRKMMDTLKKLEELSDKFSGKKLRIDDIPDQYKDYIPKMILDKKEPLDNALNQVIVDLREFILKSEFEEEEKEEVEVEEKEEVEVSKFLPKQTIKGLGFYEKQGEIKRKLEEPAEMYNYLQKADKDEDTKAEPPKVVVKGNKLMKVMKKDKYAKYALEDIQDLQDNNNNEKTQGLGGWMRKYRSEFPEVPTVLESSKVSKSIYEDYMLRLTAMKELLEEDMETTTKKKEMTELLESVNNQIDKLAECCLSRTTIKNMLINKKSSIEKRMKSIKNSSENIYPGPNPRLPYLKKELENIESELEILN